MLFFSEGELIWIFVALGLFKCFCGKERRIMKFGLHASLDKTVL